MKKMKSPLEPENLTYIARIFQHKSVAVSSYYAKEIGANLLDTDIMQDKILNVAAGTLGMCDKLPPNQCLNCDQFSETSGHTEKPFTQND